MQGTFQDEARFSICREPCLQSGGSGLTSAQQAEADRLVVDADELDRALEAA
jgi:hypothetical protein